jgi:bifunctional N-acetylglucosamine-1-phosphate-uridyltransferase/glucosamine-1-phosphate-acetyltransferase GlmU-like protein
MVVDRLRGVTMLFNANKDSYYRQQLHAIQIDTALILHADPYGDNPLTDLGDDIQELVHQETKANPQAMLAAVNGDVSSIAGKIYSEFANEVNDAMEVRDAALAEEQVRNLICNKMINFADIYSTCSANMKKSSHSLTTQINT